MRFNHRTARVASAALSLFSMGAFSSAHSALYPLQEKNWSVYSHSEAFSHSEPVPLKKKLTKWKNVEDFQPGETQWYALSTELGFRHGKFSLGVGRKIYSVANFTKDFSEYRYLTKNKLPLPKERPLDVRVNINHFEGDALTFGYHHRLGALNVSLGLSYLEGYKVTDGELSGIATVHGGGESSMVGEVDYVYSKRSLFNRKVSAPEGSGASLDIHLNYALNERLKLALDVNNALSHVRWDDAPYTRATANSDNGRTDEDGYVVYDPVISGEEKNEDRTQQLPVQYLGKVDYLLSPAWLAQFQLHKFSQKVEPAVGFTNRTRLTGIGRFQWQVQYWTTLEVVEFGVSKGDFAFAISADRYDLEKAKTAKMILRFAKSF